MPRDDWPPAASLLYLVGHRVDKSNKRRLSYLEESEMRVTGTQAPNVPDDAVLIARLRGGDQSAMSDLYDRYSAVVYGVALRVLGDTMAAEDVLQEVFLQLWRRPGSFDSG